MDLNNFYILVFKWHCLRVIVSNSGTQMRVRDSSATRIIF